MKRIYTLPKLPDRPKDGHKGLFGRVLVIGGSSSMLGAPVMSGTAALRMGSGLVQLALPPKLTIPALSITPELIGTSDEPGAFDEAVDAADVVLIGPGMGKTPGAWKTLKKLLTLDLPMVIDADALNLLAEQKTWPKNFKARAVLTPHPGEMKRLAKLIGRDDVPSDEKGRIDIAMQVAKAFKQVIVLKGLGTVVTDGQRIYVNRTGDSSLSKAGTGDVLTGVIGSLIGQKMEPFDAACAGTWLHGKAGELAGKKLGERCVLARDVIEALPESLREY